MFSKGEITCFCSLIQDMCLGFVKIDYFPGEKYTSVTTIVYKNSGDPYLLINYTPIALTNVDVNILTKLLSMRLATVLPSIIQDSLCMEGQ